MAVVTRASVGAPLPSRGKRGGGRIFVGAGVFAAVGVWSYCRSDVGGTAQVLTIDNINKNLVEMEYAVRGAVPIRAEEIAAEMAAAKDAGQPNPYPFEQLLACNIGNPQAVGQAPITFYRQVLSLVDSPSLLKTARNAVFRKIVPKDVVARAVEMTDAIKGGTGAYSHSQGVPLVRRHVCDFIDERDGPESPPCKPQDIFLVNGASAGIQSILTTLISGPNDAVMVPIPQYPIYSAVIKLLGGAQVGYYLDESSDWGLSVAELDRSLQEATAKGLRPRALVLINPGNPTGQVLSEENLRDVIKFCKDNGLVLLSDEVYQRNVYIEGYQFVSARKALHSMGPEYQDLELASFHSTSKGLIGECGRRGGYMELIGFDPKVQAEIYKLQSSQLCPNLDGQVMTSLMVKGPKVGDPSYKLFEKESNDIFNGLRRKAEVLVKRLNEIDGVTTNLASGAMYVFVSITLPPKALAAAAEQGKAADQLYCLSLLESTGIITVPGSGFGQKEGELHFRTTFLPPEDKLFDAIDRFQAHHEAFIAKYS